MSPTSCRVGWGQLGKNICCSLSLEFSYTSGYQRSFQVSVQTILIMICLFKTHITASPTEGEKNHHSKRSGRKEKAVLGLAFLFLPSWDRQPFSKRGGRHQEGRQRRWGTEARQEKEKGYTHAARPANKRREDTTAPPKRGDGKSSPAPKKEEGGGQASFLGSGLAFLFGLGVCLSSWFWPSFSLVKHMERTPCHECPTPPRVFVAIEWLDSIQHPSDQVCVSFLSDSLTATSAASSAAFAARAASSAHKSCCVRLWAPVKYHKRNSPAFNPHVRDATLRDCAYNSQVMPEMTRAMTKHLVETKNGETRLRVKMSEFVPRVISVQTCEDITLVAVSRQVFHESERRDTSEDSASQSTAA